MKYHVRNIGYIDVSIAITIKYPVAVSHDSRTDWDMNVQDMIFSGLFSYRFPIFIDPGESAFRIIYIFLSNKISRRVYFVLIVSKVSEIGTEFSRTRRIYAKYYPTIMNSEKDVAAFLKGALYLFDGSLNVYGDAQWRHIDYSMAGYDPDARDLDHSFHYDFPNAKAGATLSLGRYSNLYASAALANKEPTRSDIKDAITTGDEIKPERLWDYEFGYRFNSSHLSFAVNAYLMEYKDQLVETGKISESGYMIKKNIPDSYRRGIELSLGWKIIESLRLDANTTLSRNKIVTDEGLLDLMLSPGYIGAYSLQWDAAKWLTLTLADKVVGKQYFDNTSNPDHMLDAYNVLNLGAVCTLGSFKVSAFVNNLLNSKYIADAWSYGDDCGYFPAAPINGLLKFSYRF